MTLLILGGTGTLGRQIVRKALENGFQVRCIVRNKKAANFLKEWGAELVYGDLTIPETLPFSFQGITALIDASTTKSEDNSELIHVDWYGKLIVIELAKYTQLKRFIFLSILNSEKYPYITLMQMKYRIEKFIESSTIPFTIFKYAGFFQGLIYQYAIPILEQKPIIITLESPTISYIDTQDAAKAILNEVSNPRYEKNLVALVGEKAWNSKDIISLCERLSGKTAKISYIPTPILFILSRFFRFFEFTWNIADRLQFADIVSNEERALNEFQWNINRLSLESYFQEYFGKILKKLRETNYQQSQKSKDISFL